MQQSPEYLDFISTLKVRVRTAQYAALKFYGGGEILAPLVAELAWSHNVVIMENSSMISAVAYDEKEQILYV